MGISFFVPAATPRPQGTVRASAYSVMPWATPYKDRLMPLPHSRLHIFRYIAQKLLEIREYSCVAFVQSNEKSDCASARQSLCGIAFDTYLR